MVYISISIKQSVTTVSSSQWNVSAATSVYGRTVRCMVMKTRASTIMLLYVHGVPLYCISCCLSFHVMLSYVYCKADLDSVILILLPVVQVMHLV